MEVMEPCDRSFDKASRSFRGKLFADTYTNEGTRQSLLRPPNIHRIKRTEGEDSDPEDA